MYFISTLFAATLYILPLIQALPSSYDQHFAKHPIRVSISRTENGHVAAVQRSIAGEQVLNKRDNNNTASLYNASGREYIIQVQIGTPPQQFDLTLDTGSSELWVPSSECSVDMCPYSRFNQTQSSSLNITSKTFSAQYSVGQANGTYVYETVRIGNATIDNQLVGLVNTTKNILGIVKSGEQSNGILGLGYPGLNTVRGVDGDIPFAFSLVKAKIISNPIFSVYLNSLLNYGNSGEITFGGTDPTKYNGTLEYVPVVSYRLETDSITNINTNISSTSTILVPNVGSTHTTADSLYLYWSVPGQGVATSNGGYVNNMSDPRPFTFDTGTTLTYVPSNVSDSIMHSLSGDVLKVVFDTYNGVYRVGCDFGQKATSEFVEFHLSTSVKANITRPVIVKVSVVDLVIPLDGTTLANSKLCMFGIAPSVQDSIVPAEETWVIGQSVLRSVYTVYDMSKNRIGIAPAINTNSTNGGADGSIGTGTDTDTTTTTTQPNKNGSSFVPISDAQSLLSYSYFSYRTKSDIFVNQMAILCWLCAFSAIINGLLKHLFLSIVQIIEPWLMS
ncbi:hypothetical protein PHYBLDRAFT_70358 [Phycomyces blakesleeanus NRRL 1555(-)]|uniref:Peptidase A1 domain-containing protein n=1 Tax=Phycomyces blakesleeanus (strain ATCC 8743b / DSM 1359 / FGSC 10004 / NBRC 33097 / NRRL 1555) TaxID=763407 RepID=A0A162TGP8_PHYB8|nr:hypothetical protein PHYBLDRAFT_70358 [Phycomyces blakesleeanus NRRL 1555(-)]OAD67003.1 hypothetical protein PHYBLDRAFT_70358 [Phycomyces blakesleeanus NRRL 1555(-)]|eukprot:XP_018285043.1 hypothetical protein PHYBLDRAFT_70358 [Phycomyces blakesleeanus NRRL 1555(-)]